MQTHNIKKTVVITSLQAEYPLTQPYHPSCDYPEYGFKSLNTTTFNHVYDAVRNLLKTLNLDAEKFNTSAWNPFGSFIKPGFKVLVKPNMVKEAHLTKPDDFDYVITHGSVIRAICDYIFIALNGTGEIIVADGPETDADFDLICKRNGLTSILDFYSNTMSSPSFKVLDLRKEQWRKKDGVIVDKRPLPGDPAGYTIVSLDQHSEFIGHGDKKDYYGATFDKGETQKHHHGNVHEYLISTSVLQADVVINLPKLKTHKKSGMTCCLKNLVGINGDKNWLPHHTEGTPCEGGDQFPRKTGKVKFEQSVFGTLKAGAARSRLLSRFLGGAKQVGRLFLGSTEEVVRSGNWHGNDTVWRMILDLNKVLLHFDAQGGFLQKPRTVFCIVDGVVGGEGIGPMHPDRKPLGLLVGGFDSALVDRCCAKIMGFDYQKIPTVRNAFHLKTLVITQGETDPIPVISDQVALNGELDTLTFPKNWAFTPHFGWKGHIEIDHDGRA